MSLTLALPAARFAQGRRGAAGAREHDVTLTVAAGEMVAVMGPSGSGKSSLLTIAGTLEEPASGAVLVNGKDTLRMSGGAKSRLRRQTIGYVFQDFNLLLAVATSVIAAVWAGRAACSSRSACSR